MGLWRLLAAFLVGVLEIKQSDVQGIVGRRLQLHSRPHLLDDLEQCLARPPVVARADAVVTTNALKLSMLIVRAWAPSLERYS